MTNNATKSGKRTTIREVASLAGVSISTVSHVFSGSRPISEQTKKRVRAAALQLNYQADPSARSLRSSKSGIIGLILRPKDAIHGTLRGTETFQNLLSSIATHSLEHGRGLIHVPDVLDSSATNVAMDACIVAHPYYDDKVIAELRTRGTPIVMIDADPVHDDLQWAVNIDFATPTTDLLDAMLAKGSRHITFVPGTEDNAWNRIATKTYLQWCTAHDVEADIVAVFEGAGKQGAADAAEDIFSRAHKPDAVLTGPSTFARGVLDVASKHGIDAPNQLTIAALTDSELTRTSNPPVTSVDLHLGDAGAEAVRLAIRLVDGEEPPSAASIVHPDILWRESLPKPE